MRAALPKKNIAKHLPYQERLRNYERDKQALLSAMRDLPAKDFSEKLKELQEKWDV
ncbi:MAG: hypothetical protein J6S14_02390 [Clostridia bacterium]|nr:hypothetical protein [Clostridia bacterium]